MALGISDKAIGRLLKKGCAEGRSFFGVCEGAPTYISSVFYRENRWER